MTHLDCTCDADTSVGRWEFTPITLPQMEIYACDLAVTEYTYG